MGRLLTRVVFSVTLLTVFSWFLAPSYFVSDAQTRKRGVAPVLETSDSNLRASFQAGWFEVKKKVANENQPWKTIWLIGALVDPQASSERMVSEVDRIQKKTGTDPDDWWWLIAAWETFLWQGDIAFLKTILPAADALMNRLEDPQEGKNLVLSAQAWRVLGWMHGLIRSRGRSLYCENQFQQGRLRLQSLSAREKTELSAKALALGVWWEVFEAADVPEEIRVNQFQILSQEEGDVLATLIFFRQTLGLTPWPYDLAVKPQRLCPQTGPLSLQEFAYRKGMLEIKIEGCGRTRRSFKVNDVPSERIPGNLEGPKMVQVRLEE